MSCQVTVYKAQKMSRNNIDGLKPRTCNRKIVSLRLCKIHLRMRNRLLRQFAAKNKKTSVSKPGTEKETASPKPVSVNNSIRQNSIGQNNWPSAKEHKWSV